MTKETWYKISNVAAIICGTWFLLTGWFWAYLAALIVAWPFGFLGFTFWMIGRNDQKKTLNKIAGYLLLTGVAASIAAFFILIILN
jgi:hypothetical protein